MDSAQEGFVFKFVSKIKVCQLLLSGVLGKYSKQKEVNSFIKDAFNNISAIMLTGSLLDLAMALAKFKAVYGSF